MSVGIGDKFIERFNIFKVGAFGLVWFGLIHYSAFSAAKAM